MTAVVPLSIVIDLADDNSDVAVKSLFLAIKQFLQIKSTTPLVLIFKGLISPTLQILIDNTLPRAVKVINTQADVKNIIDDCAHEDPLSLVFITNASTIFLPESLLLAYEVACACPMNVYFQLEDFTDRQQQIGQMPLSAIKVLGSRHWRTWETEMPTANVMCRKITLKADWETLFDNEVQILLRLSYGRQILMPMPSLAYDTKTSKTMPPPKCVPWDKLLQMIQQAN